MTRQQTKRDEQSDKYGTGELDAFVDVVTFGMALMLVGVTAMAVSSALGLENPRNIPPWDHYFRHLIANVIDFFRPLF